MVNVYMSSAESEARSPYAQQAAQQSQYSEGNATYGYSQNGNPIRNVSGEDTSYQYWDDNKGKWAAGQPPVNNAYQNQNNQQNGATAPDQRSQAVQEAQGVYRQQESQKNYFARPDIFKPDDPAQLNLMRQGYTPEQSAEMLRVDAAKRQDYAGERKYETLRQQADATTVSVASGYHHWAIDTGLPQDPNPFEYAADLALYAEKGYPRKDSEQFSPVDYTALNLAGGKGGQDYVWLSDSQRNYDLRPAMDTIAQAKRAGTMGAYGQLGNPTSSKYGILSLADQQDIGRYVNENPIHQANGFITNDAIGNQRTDEILGSWRGAYVSSISPTIASQKKGGYLTNDEIFRGATEQTVYTPSPSTQYLKNLGATDPVNKGLLAISTFLTPGTYETTKTIKPQEVDRSRINPSGGAMWTAKFIDPTTNRPSDTLKTAEGSPYLGADGKMYQDYRIDDLSKVTLSGSMVTSTPGKSGYDILQEQGSNFAYDKLGAAMGVTGAQAKKAVSLNDMFARERANAAPTPANLAQSMGSGMIKDTLDRPVEGAAIFTLSLAGGAAFRGVEAVGVSALPSITRFSPTLAKIGSVGWKALPYAMTAVYTGTTAYRVTEGFSDFKPGNVSSRVGGVLATEAIPMTGGFIAGYRSPEAIFGKKVDTGYYPIDNTRVGSGGMFEQGRLGIDTAELASGGQFRSTPYSGPAFVKTGTIREGGIFGQGGIYPKARGAYYRAAEPGTGQKTPAFDNERATMAMGGTKSKYGVNPRMGMYEMPSAKSIIDYPGGVGGKVRTSYQYGFFPERPQVDYGAMFTPRPLAAPKPVASDMRFGFVRAADVTPTRVSARMGYDTPTSEMYFLSLYAGTPKTSTRMSGLVTPMYRMEAIAREAAKSEAAAGAFSQSFANVRSSFAQSEAATRGRARTLSLSAGIFGASTARARADTRATAFSSPFSTAVPGSGASSRSTPDSMFTPASGARAYSISRPYSYSYPYQGMGGGGRGFTSLPIPFGLPSFGGGSLMGSMRVGRGRKSTQIFAPSFGQMTASLFGGSPRSVAPSRAAPKKKRKR